MVQLHGAETPDRVRAIRALLQVPVIKAVGIAAREDLGKIPPYEAVADYLMFDAKPIPGKDDALPGGNARSFDWSMLTGRASAGPWFLAGGLTPENLAEAVAATGAAMVDVSSGVEEKRGVKDTGKYALSGCRPRPVISKFVLRRSRYRRNLRHTPGQSNRGGTK